MSKKSCEAAESAVSAFCEWARLNAPSQASCAQAARPNAQPPVRILSAQPQCVA